MPEQVPPGEYIRSRRRYCQLAGGGGISWRSRAYSLFQLKPLTDVLNFNSDFVYCSYLVPQIKQVKNNKKLPGGLPVSTSYSVVTALRFA